MLMLFGIIAQLKIRLENTIVVLYHKYMYMLTQGGQIYFNRPSSFDCDNEIW